MPWLYYVHSTRLDESNDIPTQFTFARGARNSKLRLWAARYQLNGTFLGLAPVTGGLLQLCRSDKAVLDAAFVFGRSYEQTCSIPVRDLWDSYELEFADLYLEIVEGETRKLYPIPVLNQNLNRNSGVKKQEYVRRIFLVDNVSGRVSSAGFHSKAQVVRYLKSFTLHIQLQATKDGRIFPPYVEVEYDQVRVEEYDDEDEKKRETRFAVTYRMETFRHEKDLEIALGTLCSFGVLWTLLRTLAWSRRAGKSVVDFASVAKFILVLAGTLSDIFFIVCLATSLWILVSYKNQLTVVYMVLSRDQELSFTVYVGVACALKAVEMFNLVLEQVGAETFFIDWERPRGQVMPKQREGTAAEAGGGGDDPEAPPPPPPAQPQDTVESPITIWRTYLVANEWAELSSYRSLPVLVTSPVALLVSLVILGKTSYTLQLFAMVVLLKAAQLENIALVEPDITWGYVPKEFADSRMNRFGLAAALYLALGLFQWFVNVFIVERCFVNHFGNFVDLCSIGNISVLCLTRPQFGYYIHGRSVHGHSDTNMREMNEMLQRERDNLCSRRGLETNDDIQTFTVVLPPSFREAYENVVAPLRNKNPAAGRVSGEDLVTVQTETVIGVYERLNAFLTSFVEKRGGWKYGVRDRTALEAILDIDFGDTSVSADFLRDISEAGFSAAFLYGHEWTQLSFDALVFCTADLVLHDFLLAAAITFLVVSIIRKIRGQGGVRRLVRTSLVDKRFLI